MLRAAGMRATLTAARLSGAFNVHSAALLSSRNMINVWSCASFEKISSPLVRACGIATFAMSNRIDMRTSNFRGNRGLASKSAKLKKKEEMDIVEQLSIPHRISFDNAKSALDQRIKPGKAPPLCQGPPLHCSFKYRTHGKLILLGRYDR